MPKDQELPPGLAKKLVEDHEKLHGRDMTDKIPAGSTWGTHGVPTKAELDEEPDWHKKGKKLDDLPDDFE